VEDAKQLNRAGGGRGLGGGGAQVTWDVFRTYFEEAMHSTADHDRHAAPSSHELGDRNTGDDMVARGGGEVLISVVTGKPLAAKGDQRGEMHGGLGASSGFGTIGSAGEELVEKVRAKSMAGVNPNSLGKSLFFVSLLCLSFVLAFLSSFLSLFSVLCLPSNQHNLTPLSLSSPP
jgi:hypothetical protein